MTSDAHSQQLPPVYSTTTVTTDDNLDIVGLVYPQFSSTAVEPFSPHVVGSVPPLEEFTEPMYNQIHQELFVAREITLNIVEHPAYMQPIGWQNTWEQAPGVPATRRALDNEELFVIEGSKTDPWRSTPENWRSAKKAAFHSENPIPDVIRAAC